MLKLSALLEFACFLVFFNLSQSTLVAANASAQRLSNEAVSSFTRSVDANRAAQARKNSRVTQAAQARIPVYFEENQGQFDSQVLYASRYKGQTLFLTPLEAVLLLRRKAGSQDDEKSGVVKMRLTGSSQARSIEAFNPLAGRVNYIIGNDHSKWHVGIPTFGGVEYREVYPGVDLVYHGSEGALEYDFRLAPGADPSKIEVAFDGASRVKLNPEGNLMLQTAAGEVEWVRPKSYQEIDGKRKELATRYVLRPDRKVTFEVAAYDRTKPLVIDPRLVFSTYLGGTNFDQAFGAAVDSSGAAYIAGLTESANFPLQGALQGSLKGQEDAFLTKMNSAGTALVYSTYFGGTSNDFATDIAIDSFGNAAITGQTTSTDLPTTSNPYQSANHGGVDAFITVFNSTGGSLIYSSYFGGENFDAGESLAYDLNGNLHFCGYTQSTMTFPTTSTAYQTKNGGGYDAFVAVINPSANLNASLVYSTYLGGSGTDLCTSVAVDLTGRTYVVGNTYSTNFPTSSGALSMSAIGGEDTFFALLDTTKSFGAALLYSTYLGGTGSEDAWGVAADSAGDAYIAGDTASSNFPITTTAYSTTNSGASGTSDGFITKINPSLSGINSLVYSTYLGGSSFDTFRRIRVDGVGRVFVSGYTQSSNYPHTAGAAQPTFGGNDDAVFSVLDTNTSGVSGLLYSTFLGGPSNEVALGLGYDGAATAVVAGYAGPSFPTTLGVFQPTFTGKPNAFTAFVTKYYTKIVPVAKAAVFLNGTWIIDQNDNHAVDSFPPDREIQWGSAGVKPVMGDWNGSGTTKVGLYSNGLWYLDYNGDGIFTPGIDKVYNFGTSASTPVVGDWNGDGRTKIGIYQSGVFILDSNGNGVYDVGTDPFFGWGPTSGAQPVIGDWNGNGLSKVGIFDNGFWVLDYNGDGIYEPGTDKYLQWGQPNGIPVVGDWNGSGTTKIGSWALGPFGPDVGQFVLDANGDYAYEEGIDPVIPWGDNNSVPLVGDWNGDGRDKIGVYSNGVWVIDYNGDFQWTPNTVPQENPFQYGGCGNGVCTAPKPGNW